MSGERPAAQGHRLASTIAKTALFSAVVPGTVTLLIPWWLWSLDHRLFDVGFPGARLLGLALVGIGVAVYLWCAFEFVVGGRGTPAPIDPPGTLVRAGPYLFSRNPMYVALVTVLLGEALALRQSTLLVYAVLAFLGCHLWILTYEEPRLQARFGERFSAYRAEVPRWVPGMGGRRR